MELEVTPQAYFAHCSLHNVQDQKCTLYSVRFILIRQCFSNKAGSLRRCCLFFFLLALEHGLAVGLTLKRKKHISLDMYIRMPFRADARTRNVHTYAVILHVDTLTRILLKRGTPECLSLCATISVWVSFEYVLAVSPQ